MVTMQNAPWETPKPPPVAPAASSQTQDLERILGLAEGLIDRVLPKVEKFMQSFRETRDGGGGQSAPIFQDVGPGMDAGVPAPSAQVVQAPQHQPVVSAEDVYGMVFDMLNLVPDETSCGDMRKFLRDNKETVVGQLRAKFG